MLKKNLKVVLGIAIVAIAGVAVGTLSKKDVAPVVPLEEAPKEEVVAAPTKVVTKKPSSSSPVVVDNRSYTELINAYKGKTLQFGATCQVLKSTQVYKLGTDILLDNRTSSPVVIKIGGASYNLGAYGYKVVDLPNLGEFAIDCGSQQNVATITVQK